MRHVTEFLMLLFIFADALLQNSGYVLVCFSFLNNDNRWDLLMTSYVPGTAQALYITEVTTKSKGLDQGWKKMSADPRLESKRAKATWCTIGSSGDYSNPRRSAPPGANKGCSAQVMKPAQDYLIFCLFERRSKAGFLHKIF